MSNVNFLENQLHQLKDHFPHRDALNVEVSRVDVAWHIDHSLKVINKIYDRLENSNPADYKWQFNFPRLYIWTTGNVPRGRGRSPKEVFPPAQILTEDIYAQLEEAHGKVKRINSLDPKNYFRHGIFGNLDRKEANRFMVIHTNHHLKIIRDILK